METITLLRHALRATREQIVNAIDAMSGGDILLTSKSLGRAYSISFLSEQQSRPLQDDAPQDAPGFTDQDLARVAVAAVQELADFTSTPLEPMGFDIVRRDGDFAVRGLWAELDPAGARTGRTGYVVVGVL